MLVSEKTLELNVSANILQDIRDLYPNAFLQGFALHHEALNGLDVSVSVPNANIGLGLQFKKPTSMRNGVYKFSINNNCNRDQHEILYGMAELFTILLGRIPPIYYAFPTIMKDEIPRITPNFYSNTYLISPLEFPTSIIDGHIHYVKINTRNNHIEVNSKPIKITNFFMADKLISQYSNPKKPQDQKKLEPLNIDTLQELHGKQNNPILKLIQNKRLEDHHFFSEKIFKRNWSVDMSGIMIL